jgi:KaiC/GvpD/RAD55 family RecA-like ATPase
MYSRRRGCPLARTSMSIAVRLPAELRAFLALKGPQSLLIRGPPGSGKSTLCLALLEASAGKRVLVTSRVSGPELQREFPWLGQATNGGFEVVDSSDVEPPFEHRTTEGRPVMVLDEMNRAQEQELEEFLYLPSPVQEAWSRLPPDGPATLVVDSWDALVEQYLGLRRRGTEAVLDRGEVERMLLRRMGRVPCHLVLVLEREEQTQLDYLVNGVVVTRRELVADRLERWLLLPKLRGIRVANASYPYTVEGAKFQAIEPVRPYGEMSGGEFQPEPDPVPGFLWPGSRCFADSFGRLPLGKVSLFESEDDVPDQVIHHILRPAVRFVLSRGGRVLLVPSAALTAEEVWDNIEGLPEGAGFRVVDIGRQLASRAAETAPERVPLIVEPASLVASASSPGDDTTRLASWLRGSGPTPTPGLAVIYESGVESLAAALRVTITPDMAANFVGGIQSTLGSTNLHLVAVGRPASALFRSVRSLAAIRIQVHNRQGRVFLYGSKPWTSGFVLTDEADGGPYELLRIV